eukprot:s1999_g5.t2
MRNKSVFCRVLFAIFGDSLTGLMLMELTDNDVAGAVSLISFIVRCDQAPFEMQSAAGQCLVQLTTADSVFLSKTDAGGEDWQNEQITKLTNMLNRHVNGLIQGIIQFDIVEAFGRCICQHQMSHARTDIIVKYFLTTVAARGCKICNLDADTCYGVVTCCSHLFCGPCFSQWVEYQRDGAEKPLPSVPCPACMRPLKREDVKALEPEGSGSILWRLYSTQKEHGGACVWVGPLLEYKEHMHKCVDGAAAFIKARLEPMPVTLFCSSIATEPSKDISKSCSLKSNPPNPQADLQPVPAKQACSGRETGSKAPKHVKDVQKWQQDAQTEAAKLAPQAVTKVVLCRHFEKLGTCRLGAKCTFAHGKEELQTQPNCKGLRKTMLCRHFEQGHCWRGESCMFAHGEGELRDKKLYLPPEVLLRKSQLCRHFMGTGVCWFGDSCNFAHGEDDLQANNSTAVWTKCRLSGSDRCTEIHNCLLYCSANQKKLRQHLATQSTIVQDIMIPYVYNILPALFDNPACGPALIEWQNLKATLQTFVVVTFNINVFRPHLRDSDMIPKICEVPRILTHISMLELLVKTAINVDYPKGPFCGKLTETFQAAFDQLPTESQARLQRRMTCEQSMRLPFSRSSVKAVELLSFAFGAPEASPEAAAANHSTKQRKWRNAKNKARRRKKLFSMQASSKNGEEPEADDEQGEDSEDDMPPLIPGDGWEASLGTADEAGVPQKAVCQLSGALMHDPVSTPDGYLFERAALEDWTSQHGSNPLTGAPLAMDEVVDREDIANFIQGYQLQMLSVTQVAPEAIDGAEPEVRAAPDPDVPAPPPTKPVETGPSLLGDLPALSKTDTTESKRKDKAKIRIESRSVVDCPEDMRCAIDGKVMVNPVLSRYGHHFERKTLEKWFGNCGSVCPITQKPLRLEECQPDQEMKKRIVNICLKPCRSELGHLMPNVMRRQV